VDAGIRIVSSIDHDLPSIAAGRVRDIKIMPAVSVIMVFHRLNPFMAEAVDSVLNQTFRDLELILVDNGTGLDAGVFGEAGRDSRVRFVRLPRNEGIPGGHNAGIAAAQSEFIALLDYDDLMLPTRVERQLMALRADSSLGLVSSRVQRINEAGRAIGEEFTLLEPDAQYAYSQYAAPFPTPACMGRREVFANFPYREQFPFAADFDFQTRVPERFKTRALNEVLFSYRWYPAQTTQDKAAAIEQNRAAIRLMTARRRAGRDEQFDQIKSWIAQGSTDASAAGCWAARQALAERLYPLAAYQARRMFALRRTPRNATKAMKLGLRAIAGARGGERRLAVKMLFRGPVKALGVQPSWQTTPLAPSAG
jgi:hypothetical protein